MAKKKKASKKEIVPEGMRREDYADAAFRKKVTIIMGSILLVFIIGICAVIFWGWYNNEQLNKEFEAKQNAFKQEKAQVIMQLQKIEDEGGEFEDKAQVKIEVTDENFSNWISALDDSYQASADDPNHRVFGGATIHLQGMFVTREFKGGTQYWVYRNHSHEEGEHHDHDETEIGEMIPIEIIFRDGAEVSIPEDGTWVDVTGIVGPDSTKNISGVRYAEMTLMDEPGNEYIE